MVIEISKWNFFLSLVLIVSWYRIFVHDGASTFTSSAIYRDDEYLRPVTERVEAAPPADHKTAQCLGLDFDEAMDRLLSAHNQVFVAMPAKAAGSTMKRFTSLCTNTEHKDNAFNPDRGPMYSKSSRRPMEEILTMSLHPPALMASHLYDDGAFQSLVKHATRQSLIIYIHREETTRLLSAIKEVATRKLCSAASATDSKDKQKDNRNKNEPPCLLTEKQLVTAIKNKVAEIDLGAPKLLTCDSYDAIADNSPNLIILHYQQASRLQKLLAKRFCPELLDGAAVSVNVGSDKRAIHVVLGHASSSSGSGSGSGSGSSSGSSNGDMVSLDEWLEAKRNLLEYALQLKTNVSCQAKTRAMEDALLACPDETLRF